MNLVTHWRNSRLRYKLMMWDVHGPIFQWSDREKMILEALRFVRANQVVGDYYEFGVGSGYTLGVAARISKKLKLFEMELKGFDSFEGLPEVEGADRFGSFKKGDYAYTIADVYKNYPHSELGRVCFFKLWFKDLATTCQQQYFGLAAVVWIDCDLYESALPVLEWITPLLQDGAIICFDDWNCFKGNPHKGEKFAFAEWLRKHPEWKTEPFLNFGWHGASFIMMKEKTM